MIALKNYLFIEHPLKEMEFKHILDHLKIVQERIVSIFTTDSKQTLPLFKQYQKSILDLFKEKNSSLYNMLKKSGLLQDSYKYTRLLKQYIDEMRHLQELEEKLFSQPIANKSASEVTSLKRSQEKTLKLFEQSLQFASSVFKESRDNVKAYTVKMFCNCDDPMKGYMKCFPFSGVMFAELRIISNQEDQSYDRNKNPKSVSNCRFVYAYFKNQQDFKGLLFLTTSHYGWYMLPEEILEKILTEPPLNKRKKDIKTWSWKDKYDVVKDKFNYDKYYLQQKVAYRCSLFPFVILGTLIISNSKFSLSIDDINNTTENMYRNGY